MKTKLKTHLNINKVFLAFAILILFSPFVGTSSFGLSSQKVNLELVSTFGEKFRGPAATAKKKALDKVVSTLKKNNKIVRSKNTVRGISVAQVENLMAKGTMEKLSGKGNCWKWKVGRTAARVIFASDQKTVLWAGSDHGMYERKIRELCK